MPPPFPFVEAWPRVFQGEERHRWLTPSTVLPFAVGGPSLGACRGLQPQECGFQAPGFAAAGTFHSKANSDLHEDFYGDFEGEIPSDGSSDGEYEYGFVLTDEWRDRLLRREQVGKSGNSTSNNNRECKRRKPRGKNNQASTSHRQHHKQQEPPSVAVNSRVVHLQQEVEAARARELATQWKQRRSDTRLPLGPKVKQLEAAMALRFDDFCDAFQPVVWPHASAQ